MPGEKIIKFALLVFGNQCDRVIRTTAEFSSGKAIRFIARISAGILQPSAKR